MNFLILTCSYEKHFWTFRQQDFLETWHRVYLRTSLLPTQYGKLYPLSFKQCSDFQLLCGLLLWRLLLTTGLGKLLNETSLSLYKIRYGWKFWERSSQRLITCLSFIWLDNSENQSKSSICIAYCVCLFYNNPISTVNTIWTSTNFMVVPGLHHYLLWYVLLMAPALHTGSSGKLV